MFPFYEPLKDSPPNNPHSQNQPQYQAYSQPAYQAQPNPIPPKVDKGVYNPNPYEGIEPEIYSDSVKFVNEKSNYKLDFYEFASFIIIFGFVINQFLISC